MKIFAVIFPLLAVSMCNPTCGHFKAINPSAQDILTRGTKTQIVSHNQTGRDVCGWPYPQ